MKPASIKHLHSAGGVIFRKKSRGTVPDLRAKRSEAVESGLSPSDASADFDVALIAMKNKTVWTLPKGIIDKGEQPETSAVREIMEETGLRGRIIDTIGDKSYWFYLKDENVKCRKTVSYFLLEYVSGNIEDYCWEVDEARWFNIEDAIEQVSYKSDREILQMAKKKLAAYGQDTKLE